MHIAETVEINVLKVDGLVCLILGELDDPTLMLPISHSRSQLLAASLLNPQPAERYRAASKLRKLIKIAKDHEAAEPQHD